jgi:DNA mismatch endonuclease, patch repair protein
MYDPKKVRSALMGRISGENTEPEVLLRKGLWSAGLRYRLHAKTPLGKPDLVFPAKRIALFLDGCFWHGCPEHYVRPRSREGFWAKKLRGNVDRDRRQTSGLVSAGWTVLRFWEHEVYTGLDAVVQAVEREVREGPSGGAKGTVWRVVQVTPLSEDGSVERRVLERLHDPEDQRVVEGHRSTAKW